MKIYTQKDLAHYLEKDIILAKLSKYPDDSKFSSHKWLLDIPAKRFIYNDVYGQLIEDSGKKILDIGGGFCGLSRELIKRHDYMLIDIMAHDNHDVMQKLSVENGNFWVNGDWEDFKILKHYDYVIANDIFPNVDQRLGLFIKKFLPHADKIIATLTCYDEDRYYSVKRLNADEIFTIVPWNCAITEMVLQQNLPGGDIKLADHPHEPSLFKNGRVVYRLEV